MWFFAKAHDAHASDGGDCKRCAKRFELCQLSRHTRRCGARGGDADAACDILRGSLAARQTSNGHKLTRIVSAFGSWRQSYDSRGLLDAELLDAIAQRSKRQAEQLGSSRLVVASLLERRDDGVALDL